MKTNTENVAPNAIFVLAPAPSRIFRTDPHV